MIRKSMNTPQSPLYVWQRKDWPQWRFDPAAVQKALSSARLAQGMLLGAVHAIGFGSADLDKVLSEIWVQEAISTAAIEGQALDLDQVRSSVMRKVANRYVGASSRHIDGLVDMMDDAVANCDQPLDENRLCSWQAALFPTGRSGVEKIEVGRYRSFDEPMQIVSGRPGREVVHYRAPDSRDVPAEMDKFLRWFSQGPRMDIVIKAAIAHLWFETIHPFHDGNGRIGRAIIDSIIAQETGGDKRLYSMSRQMEENRGQYYEQLNQAQKGDLDITDWVIWFADQFAASCQKSLKHIDAALEKARYWAAHSGDEFNERQMKVLKKLLDAGNGGFLGGLTREKYTKITGCSDATATRDLSDLSQKGALASTGVGKGTKYFVNVPGWHGDSAPS